MLKNIALTQPIIGPENSMVKLWLASPTRIASLQVTSLHIVRRSSGSSRFHFVYSVLRELKDEICSPTCMRSSVQSSVIVSV